MSAEFETSLFYISEFQASQGLETETLFQENHKKEKKIKKKYISPETVPVSQFLWNHIKLI